MEKEGHEERREMKWTKPLKDETWRKENGKIGTDGDIG